jgi:Protein of unknwon function (DUF3310)
MSDAINHPAHYGGDTTYEAIKVIEAWSLGFHLGNVLKYIRRADEKGTHLTNLKKARWYLDRRIQQIEAELRIPPVVITCTRTTHPDPQTTAIQPPIIVGEHEEP